MDGDTMESVRIAERFQVRLMARFESAQSFVEEYAHNLSEGGLFIAGAFGLDPLQEVKVTLDLPGSGTWEVTCRVAHIRTPEQAQKDGQTPGAGMTIVSARPGFNEALTDYLKCLGRRRDALVLIDPGQVRDFLEGAGFQTELLPPLRSVGEYVEERPSVVGVLPCGDFLEYLEAVTPMRDPHVVFEEVGQDPDDLLLNRLDQAIRSQHATQTRAVA